MKRRTKTANRPPPPHKVTVILSILAVIISLISAGNSVYQTIETRKIYRTHIQPDIQCVMRPRPEAKGDYVEAQLVVLNNGPIKAASLSVSYRAYMYNPKTFKIIASMGIAEDLVDYAIIQPELMVGQRIVQPVFGTSPTAIYVFNITYYRESDMEKFSRREIFLADSGSYYDHKSFMSRPSYQETIKNLERKMRAEALRPMEAAQKMPPASPGHVNVFYDFANLNADGTWTNGGANTVTITPLGPIQ